MPCPDSFRVRFETTRGDFVVEVMRAWSPNGADRFHELVSAGYFADIAFFRVIKNFIAQFGIHGDPKVGAKWRDANIRDDKVVESNVRGTVSYAMAGPNTRSNQFFVNTRDNASLDRHGFSPFGRVVEGMEAVDTLYADYGEGAPDGKGPAQHTFQAKGNAYLKEKFPKLDYVKKAALVE